jgi:membrane protease YdiL (CAAX protease family)
VCGPFPFQRDLAFRLGHLRRVQFAPLAGAGAEWCGGGCRYGPMPSRSARPCWPAALATLATGGHADAVTLGLWTEIPVTVARFLLIPGSGGAWEEPGFRGYALPRLEERFGVLAAPLLLGVFWVAWHLPLFLAGQILQPDVLTIMAASVVIAGVFRSARQSVLIAMLLHATNNAVGGSYASLLFHRADSYRLGMFTAAAWWIAAVVVMVLRRRQPPVVTV